MQKNEAMSKEHAQALSEKDDEIKRLKEELESQRKANEAPKPEVVYEKPADEKEPRSPSSTGTTSPPGTFVPIANAAAMPQYTHVQYEDVTCFRSEGLVDAELAVLTAEASLQQLIQWTRHLNGTGGGRMPPPISQMQMPWTPPVEHAQSPYPAMGKGGRGWSGRGKGMVAGRGKGM